MPLRLDGSTVLLTGASSGIGREMARQLAPRVARLVLVARRVDRLEALREELRAANARLEVHLLPADLSEVAQAARLADQVAQQVGEVDVLINNAGVGDFALFDGADWERLERMIALNVTSLVLLTRRFVPGMVARGHGGVLNVSSGFGLGFLPGFATYVGSKHFVTGFTETLRLDLDGTGVVVSQVCPGPVRTEFGETASLDEGAVPGFVYLSSAHCAHLALDGFEREAALILPGWQMKLIYGVLAVSPRFMQRLVQKGIARTLRRRQAQLKAESAPAQLTNGRPG